MNSDEALVPKKKKRLVHGPEFTEGCPVCESEHCPEIESEYLSAGDVTVLAEACGLAIKDIERHMRGFGHDKTRADNTDAIVQRGINKSLDRGVFDNLDADQTLKLLQHRDRQTGKVDNNKKNDDRRPMVVVIQGVPGLGLAPQVVAPDSPLVIPGVTIEDDEYVVPVK
jgi:hypothetical protein